MFPNFSSLSQREQKRRSLIERAERDLQNDAAKRQAYSEAMWADDVEKNKINLLKNSTTTSTQTDNSATTSTSTATGPASTGSNGSPNNRHQRCPTPPGSNSGDPGGVFYTPPGSNTSPPLTRNLMDMFRDQGNADIGDEGDEGDIGDADDSLSDIADEFEMTQEEAREQIQNVYSRHIELAMLKIQPIKLATNKGDQSKPHGLVFLGANGQLFNMKGGYKSNVPDNRIDWVKTHAYIEGKLPLIDFMRNRKMNKEPDEGVVRDVFDGLKANKDYSKAQKQAYEEIIKLFINHPRKMRELAKIRIHPVDLNGDLKPGYEITMDESNNLNIYANGSTRKSPTMYKKTDWVKTHDYILEKARELHISFEGNEVSKRNAAASPNTTPSDQRKLSKITRNQQRLNVGTSSLPREPYHITVSEIVKRTPWIEFRSSFVHPVLKNGRSEKAIYLGSLDDIDTDDNPARGDVEFFRSKQPDVIVSEDTREQILANIDWMKTLGALVDRLKDVRNRTTNHDVVSSINQILKDYKISKADGSEDKDFIRDTKKYNARFNNTAKIKLEGRGLMGAGEAEVAIKRSTYTSKNLRTIEGTGTASDLKYKRLGSKFIRIADLKSNRLKLVFPNRTSVGRLRDIDPKLAKLINTLVFENDIDQALYGRLSIDDKKLFCEVLKATHLQHQYSNAPGDPLEVLKAEFDKLQGQVVLGNDNPDMIRELKALSVDLYGQKLMSEAQFREILFNL